MLDFTWQSFAFAAANFLLLAWVLHKLLHKPLLGMLEKRRADIEAVRRAAAEEMAKARRARETYEAKLAEAGRERDRLLAESRRLAEEARGKLLEQAGEQAGREIANRRDAYERERREAIRALRGEIVETGLEIAGRVLEQLTDADIESGLHKRLLAGLDGLVSKGPAPAAGGAPLPVHVRSARPLDPDRRAAIERRAKAVAGDAVEITFEEDPALVAGARVEFGAAAVDATLSDVLDRVGALAAGAPPGEARG